mmetsp:Transcript_19583/g.36440  ORF Transcript_19583/g.36440 Transcript_19583/m.36440 type:complete len:206 (-) Transcript_19583:343-960(-)
MGPMLPALMATPRNRGLIPPCTASKKLKLGLICDIVFQYTSGCWTRVSKVPANPPIVNSRAKEWFCSGAVEFAEFFDCLRESTSEEGVTAILCDESQYLALESFLVFWNRAHSKSSEPTTLWFSACACLIASANAVRAFSDNMALPNIMSKETPRSWSFSTALEREVVWEEAKVAHSISSVPTTPFDSMVAFWLASFRIAAALSL